MPRKQTPQPPETPPTPDYRAEIDGMTVELYRQGSHITGLVFADDTAIGTAARDDLHYPDPAPYYQDYARWAIADVLSRHADARADLESAARFERKQAGEDDERTQEPDPTDSHREGEDQAPPEGK